MPPSPTDLTSKELLRRTGLSRATLNNYIALGLLPRPQVAPPRPNQGRARRLGYFPAETLDRIAEINRLKASGLTMAQIVAKLAAPRAPAVAPTAAAVPVVTDVALPASPRLTIDDLAYPAYLINPNMELEWWNAPALELFRRPEGLPGPLAARHLVAVLAEGGALDLDSDAGRDLLHVHLAVAKRRLPRAALARLQGRVDAQSIARIEAIHDAAEPAPARPALRHRASIGGRPIDLYVSFFREGYLFVHAPAAADGGGLADLLGRRDQVISDLLRRRNPFSTPLAVLAAAIQDADRLCAELPAEDYFALVNLTWSTLEATFRRHHGTMGRHLGDVTLHVFFPQPDGSHQLNALACAQELGQAMREVRAQWLRRRSWPEQLTLNVGLAAGTEWFGVMPAASGHAMVTLGESMGRAQRLARAGHDRSIFATKALIAALPERERDRVRFGVHRAAPDGRTRFNAGRFARLEELAGAAAGDAGALAITEIVGVAEPAPAAAP
jgi:class 3 adenylate cyclase/DNA-binding transcriptional MerR regulator